MNKYYDGFLKYSNRISQIIMDDSNLIKISVTLIALITIGLTTCLFWYCTNDKDKTKPSNLDSKTKIIFVLEEKSTMPTEKDVNLTETSRIIKEHNKLTISTKKYENLTETSRIIEEHDKSTIFTEKVENLAEVSPVLEEEYIISKEKKDDNLTETSQEKIDEPLVTSFTPFQEENDFTIKSLQESHQEQDVVKIKDPEILSHESDNNPLENNSVELTPETASQKISHKIMIQSDFHESDAIMRPNNSTGLITGTINQETCHETVIQSNIHEPEASLQSEYEEIGYEEIGESLYQENDKNPLENDSTPNTITREEPDASAQYQSYEKISYESDDNPLANGDEVVLRDLEASVEYKIRKILSFIPKADSPITQTGKYMNTLKTDSESEVSSQSDLSEIDGDSTLMETKYEDACVQTDSKVSRSIILNDQIPVKMPLPNESALDVLNEFRLSNVVYAFSGQDLIDLEDYDEEEEIRRFLFKKNI
ncbi:hypothetical protein RclHR1_03280008 [Rhizophagus clarus]|nr:hypothetical protein RclHR1_03280008 [Rhizophagus clarus]